jgi:hypothetical protein
LRRLVKNLDRALPLQAAREVAALEVLGADFDGSALGTDEEGVGLCGEDFHVFRPVQDEARNTDRLTVESDLVDALVGTQGILGPLSSSIRVLELRGLKLGPSSVVVDHFGYDKRFTGKHGALHCCAFGRHRRPFTPEAPIGETDLSATAPKGQLSTAQSLAEKAVLRPVFTLFAGYLA